MYQIENTGELLRGRSKPAAGRRLPRVGRNVVLVGLVSLFTDLSSEMVATILPLYLVFGLGLSPLQFGVIDGLYQGVAALVRLAGGYVADRWRRYKEVATLGYGISAGCKLAFVAAGNALGWLTAIVVLDRTGKGVRTAPRDALISLSSPPSRIATAFGVHRALDTAGAMLGPLAAFLILLLAPRAYDAVFVVSFCLALVGLSILVLFVENRRPATAQSEEVDHASLAEVGRLLRQRPFQLLVLLGGGLALFTISDAFVYLALQRSIDFDPMYLPLLYTGTALVYMVLAVPFGRLADRVGRGKVFLGGYGVLLLLYASLLLPGAGTPMLVASLFLFGAYYAATDGVLMAVASSVVPEALRGSGLAILVTATSLARLLASIVVGALWLWVGIDAAVIAFGAGLVLAIVLAVVAMRMLQKASISSPPVAAA